MPYFVGIWIGGDSGPKESIFKIRIITATKIILYSIQYTPD